MKNFQRNLSLGEVEIEDGGRTIYHKTEYRERRNHYAVFSVNNCVDGFDTIRDEFLGAYHGSDNPVVVHNRQSANSVASGWAPIGSHHLKISLNPGESKNLIFVLGFIENDDDDKWESYGIINKTKAHELLNRYSEEEQVNEAFKE